MLRFVLTALLVWNSIVVGEDFCDEIVVAGPEGVTISSPGYPDTYSPGEHRTWCVKSRDNTSLSLTCTEFDISKSDNCEKNGLRVSCKDGQVESYCGSNTFHVGCSSSEIVLTLYSSLKSRGGQFSCEVAAMAPDFTSSRAVVYSDTTGCDCGYLYRGRIVGGIETGINQYPFMAGLVDRSRGFIIQCGCTIISQNFVITAAHCIDGAAVNNIAVVVGEHNVTTNSETSATRVYLVSQIIPYLYYDASTSRYDIALIWLASPISFSARVGPVCLPFDSRNSNYASAVVRVMGWGTTEFGGPRSRVLLQTDLVIVPITRCQQAYSNNMVEGYSQLCAYRDNADACQYDSGGPMIYYNTNINRYELVGIVSYGRGCASGVPAVYTKVNAFLQWIVDNTPNESLCYKVRS